MYSCRGRGSVTQVAPPTSLLLSSQDVTAQKHQISVRTLCSVPNMKICLSVLLLLLLCYVQVYGSASNGTVQSLLQCPENDICDVASRCCMSGMDSYGWIAAAVGWSLWFFTLILFCIGKVMNLRPNEPKYQQT
ncbi:transmembrane protein 213 [Mixophyes fleayi]|uniref:transmembrane protein 213 n=1 Tax=Mixophyes fleayi TaxID=3061075 RepID=UPI003F4E1EBC